ncbi:hypothetical protein [Vibrio cholerae]|uniref:hypothetical protein n=1 Tax=Vibrio cholerae TaxID=666 RepID=UPI002FE665FD
MKTFLRVLSISALHLASLGANAGESPFFDINHPPQPFDVVLDKVNDYQGELEYSYILDNGDVLRSGKTHCHSSICTIVDLPYGSLIKSGAILTLSQNGTVTYAAPYGPEYFNKNKIFSDPFSLGKYVIFELEKEGYKEQELLQKIGTDNIYKLYLALSKVYTLSQHRLQETISYIESGDLDLLRNNSQDNNYVADKPGDAVGYIKDILTYATKIPGFKEHLGTALAVLGELKNFLDAAHAEPSINLDQVYQKLDEIEQKIDRISDSLNKFYDIYASNEVRKAALLIHEKYLMTDSFSNQVSNTIAGSGDIFSYIDNSESDKEKRLNNISKILNPEALRELNTNSNLLLGYSQQASLYEGYASNLLYQISLKKSSDTIEDYTIAYEAYNNWLFIQYFESIVSASKSLYLELSALYLKVKYDAQIFPAADYGPTKTSNDYYTRAKYLSDSYKKRLDKLSLLINDYLVEPDYSFSGKKSTILLPNEFDTEQYKYTKKMLAREINIVVLANKKLTAYVTFDIPTMSKRYLKDPRVIFIPAKQGGNVFKEKCFVKFGDSGTFTKCTSEVYSNCYDSRYTTQDLPKFSWILAKGIQPFQTLHNEKWSEDLDQYSRYDYRFYNTCSKEENYLTSEEYDSINERLYNIKNRYDL